MGFSLKKLVGGIPGVDLINDMFKSPDYPKQPEPEVMPDVDDEKQKKARRRSIAAQMARSGRRSTIMTGDKETLG